MDLYVCDRAFQRFAIMDDYISLVWTDRYTKAGDITVVFSIDSPNLQYIETNLYFSFDPSDNHMIIESLITNPEANTVTVVGRDLKSLLERRINREYVIKSVHNEESAAGAATKSLQQNCLTTPILDDRFTNLIVGDHYLPWGGGPNSIRDNGARSVYDEIVSICDEPLVGWKLEFRPSYTYASGGAAQLNKLVFHCFVGTDRTVGNSDGRSAVIFDPALDNISDVSIVRSDELFSNVIAVQWGQNGTGWTYYYKGDYTVDTYNINRKAAMYTPPESLGDIDGNLGKIMAAYGRAEAARLAPIHVMDGKMLPDGPFTYGWDYGMGDKVTIGQNQAIAQNARVIEYIWSNDANGWSHYPTFKIVTD